MGNRRRRGDDALDAGPIESSGSDESRGRRLQEPDAALELESLQRELTSKLERNLELRAQVKELRASGDGELSHEERLAQANRHHALGLQYFREERPELALREIEEAVRLNPANPTIVNNYGFVLYRLGRQKTVWIS